MANREDGDGCACGQCGLFMSPAAIAAAHARISANGDMLRASEPTLCVCGHPFLAHQVDYDIRPNCRGGCTGCMCEEFREATRIEERRDMTNPTTNPTDDRNGFVVSARFKCRTCGCAAIVDGVTCSSCVESAKPSQRVAFVDPSNDREIALIGHNLAELPKLSPDARRRVSDYVKRFVDDMERP